MKRLLYFLAVCLILNTYYLIRNTGVVRAADKNIITPVFPVRDRDFWRKGKDLSYLTDIINIVEKNKQKSTWLIQYDALSDKQVIDSIKTIQTPHEVGIFLEITRHLAEDSFVVYDWSWGQWSAANKLFLSGYELLERQRMIDKVFEAFKTTFGYYPQSYGAWYVDVWSSTYIKNKFGANIQLGLADQYATDGYQVWGQYVNQPYYMSKYSAIEPSDQGDTTDILKVLWAPREPTLSYGKSSAFSNYSVQVNDYHQSMSLKTDYFIKLINTLTTDINTSISQAVIGIEVSEVPAAFLSELDRQLAYVSNNKQLTTETLSEFNQTYRQYHPLNSPSLLLRSTQKETSSWWFMSPHYRLGLFLEGSVLKINDLRFYHRTLVRDNDQSQVDTYNNLHRLVPPIIDDLSLGNAITIPGDLPPQIKYLDGETDLVWSDKSIKLLPDRLIFEGFAESDLKAIPRDFQLITDNVIQIFPQKPAQSLDGVACANEDGVFKPPFSCLKKHLTKLLKLIPDIRFSKLEGDYFFGVRTDYDHLFGVRFPHLRIGILTFQFPIIDNFLDLDKIRKPTWKWYGRQELEVQDYLNKGHLIEKTENYGQAEFLKNLKDSKIFENGYYLIYPQ